MRNAEIIRKTNETDISLSIELDGCGSSKIDTGCAFLDHMLTLFAKHGKFNLNVSCKGDTEVDAHHTTEDIGICLGQAFREALGDKAGIVRYADTTLPMDEALILTALDFSGRGYFACELDIKAAKVGDFDTELANEFWQAFAINAGATLHIRQLAGSNAHHIIEGVFKSMARTLRAAVKIDADFAKDIPSTKGIL
ncbi:MAG: imidazoleglycerol-phosphate dehydratase HisB [Clostridia bacterium]|nr:imidazoleglycerol-phosphate dehydratase HisB [Clostridia bacterium]